MIALYIILGIALLIGLILFLRARVIITYDESLRVDFRLAFFRMRLFPAKPKKIKKRKKKSKKATKAPVPTEKKDEEAKKDDGVVSKLWALRRILLHTIEKFLGKLHFKLIRLNIVVAGDNAAATALLYGATTQGVAYLIEILDTISNVDITKRSEISVKSDFISQKSSFEGKIVLYISVAHIIYVGIHFLKKLIKSKMKVEE